MGQGLGNFDLKLSFLSYCKIFFLSFSKTNYRLDEKLLDLEFRRGELRNIRKEIMDNLDDNAVFQDRMYDCLDHLKNGPLDQNRRCITLR